MRPWVGQSAPAHLAGPDERGWVVLGRCHTAVSRPFFADVVSSLHGAGLGTLVVPMGRADVATMAGWVHAATVDLRHRLAGDRPIAYLGAGRAAAAGWLAAATPSDDGLDGIMAWNPRPTAVWRHLPRVAVSSLLVVDGESLWRLALARTAGWKLGGHADVCRPRGVRDLDVLGAWFERRLLTPVPARVPVPTHRVRLASMATAAVLAAAPVPTAVAMPDFSAGGRLTAAQISGDTSRAGGVTGGTTETATEGTRVLKPGEIKGDGPIGDPPLTDGIGFRWNINTNVGFTTTTSASGAVSDAAFTHAVAASTLNGGTVNQVLSDAFDGYNALCVDLNNVGGQCNTANMAVYNQNGPASLECSGRQVVLPQSTIGNFQVRRKVFVPTNDGFARWLNIFRNTSASPQILRVVTANNLGSDTNTRIVTTSDGDATPELTDTWVSTFQNYVGSTSSDPRLAHVLRGLNAPVGLAVNNFVNGDDNPFWRYVFTLAPGQTAIIMNFATGQATKAAAATQAATLANLSNPNALACMTSAERGQVLNFRTDVTLPVCTYMIVNTSPKRIDFTVSDAGGGLSSIQITTAVNLLPVVIPPFTVGSTLPLQFSAVKNNQGQSSQVAVVITDVHGNQVSCV